jgi:hypothetical protein
MPELFYTGGPPSQRPGCIMQRFCRYAVAVTRSGGGPNLQPWVLCDAMFISDCTVGLRIRYEVSVGTWCCRLKAIF